MKRLVALVLALALAAPACAQIYPGYGTPTLLGDGSVTAPAYSFASEPGLGWYRNTSGSMGLTIGGTQRLFWDANGPSVGCATTACGFRIGSTAAGPDIVISRVNIGAIGITAGGSANTNTATLGGVLSLDTTTTGTTGAGTSTIKTYTLPASVLNVNGKGLRITAQGTTANNANAKTVSVQFCGAGGTATTLPASAFSAWRLETLFFRTASGAQNGYTRVTVDAGTTSTQQQTVASVHACTDTGTIAVLIQGSGTAVNDVTSTLLMVELLN